MSLEDFAQYALGAESREDLYEEKEELRLNELTHLRQRCENILRNQAKIEVDDVPAWLKALVYPLKKGKDNKQLYKRVTLNMPLHDGGQYQAEVKLSNGFRWVGSDQKPEIGSDDEFFIEFLPKESDATEGMDLINIVLGKEEGIIDTGSISGGAMDLGDYTMVNKMLNEFERWIVN